MRWTDEQDQTIIRMRNKGHYFREIAREVKRPIRETHSRWTTIAGERDMSKLAPVARCTGLREARG